MMQRFLLAALFVFGAAPALASGRNPQLPTSGTVIHLFGPEAGIPVPTTPRPASAPGAAKPANGVPATGISAVPAATPSDYPEPRLGTILHQMFVTGDPNRGSGFSPDRKQVH